MGASFSLTDSSVQNLFKQKYVPISTNYYNGKVPVLSLVKKSYDAVGVTIERAVPIGFQGGAGSGSLPQANRGNYQRASLSTKSVYTVCEIDRRTQKQSLNEGAFVQGLQEVVKRTVEKFNWNMARILAGQGDGSLGIISTASLVSGVTWDLVIDNANASYPWKLAAFEIRDYVNIGTGDSSLFEITAITPSTRTVRVVRISGSKTPTTSDVIFLQGSESNDPEGFPSVYSATSGSKYGITIQYRWQAEQKAAASAAISSDVLNEEILAVDKTYGLPITHVSMAHKQYQKLLATMEDQKRYVVQEPRAANLKGYVSFKMLAINSSVGEIPIIIDRHLPDDYVVGHNLDETEILHAPDFGWMDDDGTVFLRKAGADAYEARYGGYLQNYAPPVGFIITGLSTS